MTIIMKLLNCLALALSLVLGSGAYGMLGRSSCLPVPGAGRAEGSLRDSTDGVAAALGAALAGRRERIGGGRRIALDTVRVNPVAGILGEVGRWADSRETQKEALHSHVAWLRDISGQMRAADARGWARARPRA